MDWDVFINHAWEDKEDIARPLAEALSRKGLRVWYDEFTLTLGDSLRRSIDRGLAQSRYGIVILSPHFFAKEWPQRELDGLVAKEVSSGKTILPVWHNVTQEDVRRFSPTLADKLAVSTEKGLEAVVEEILRVLRVDLESESAREEPRPRPRSVAERISAKPWQPVNWKTWGAIAVIGVLIALCACPALGLLVPNVADFLSGWLSGPTATPTKTPPILSPTSTDTPTLKPTPTPYYVEIAVDASERMSAEFKGGTTKMEAAWQTAETIARIRAQQGQFVKVRLFGGRDSPAGGSCQTSHSLFDFTNDSYQIMNYLAESPTPGGEAAVVRALLDAADELNAYENIGREIILLTGGDDGCNVALSAFYNSANQSLWTQTFVVLFSDEDFGPFITLEIQGANIYYDLVRDRAEAEAVAQKVANSPPPAATPMPIPTTTSSPLSPPAGGAPQPILTPKPPSPSPSEGGVTATHTPTPTVTQSPTHTGTPTDTTTPTHTSTASPTFTPTATSTSTRPPPFVLGPPFGTGSDRTFDLAFGDADKDGDLDLAVGNHGPNQMCWNNGDGTFNCEDAFGGDATFDVDWGDMDRDSNLDLVVANSSGQPNRVCFNKGGHIFSCTSFSTCSVSGQSCHTALGDVDDNSDLDIALAIWQLQDLIYINSGDGTFSTSTTTCTDFGWSRDLDFGDVDGDDDLDLVVVGDSPDYVCINDGTGTFAETRSLVWRQDSTWSVDLGDVDGDGDLDIAAGESSMHQSEIYLNDGHGDFTRTLLIGPTSDLTCDIALGDVDNDGDLDIAAGNLDQHDVVYFNDNLTFTRTSILSTDPSHTGSVAFGDIDRDGDLDLAVGYDGGQNVIYLNTLR